MTNLRKCGCALMVTAVALFASGCIVKSGRGDTSRAIGEQATCPIRVNPSITGQVRIGFQKIANADLIVKDKGLLEKCAPNMKISWNAFDSGGAVVQAFGANSLDMGSLGSNPATKAVSAPLNIPMKVVWIHDVIGGAESLVVRNPSVKSIDQLAGAKIGVPAGSTSDYSLTAALDKAGLTKKVTKISLEPGAMPGAWETGQIDAAWVWDPTLSELKKSGHVIYSSADTAKAGNPTFDLEGATTSFIDANPQFITMWARLQSWAVQLIKNKPQDAAESVSAQLGIPPNAVAPQFAGYTYLTAKQQASTNYLGGTFAEDLHQTAQFLLDQGEIGAVGPVSRYAHAIYVRAAKEASGS